MTTETQRTQALIYAGDFLEELAAAETGANLQVLRERAKHLLRHYPSNTEIAWIAKAAASSAVNLPPVLDPAAVPDEIRTGYRIW